MSGPSKYDWEINGAEDRGPSRLYNLRIGESDSVLTALYFLSPHTMAAFDVQVFVAPRLDIEALSNVLLQMAAMFLQWKKYKVSK